MGTTLAAIVTALPAFMAALPYLCQVLLKLMEVGQKLSAWSKEKDFLARLNEIEATIDLQLEAKTSEQKKEAARSMVDLIRSLT